MQGFSSEEIDEIDRLWRSVPPGHVWTGWAATGDLPDRIWIFRTQAHWRRFPLIKEDNRFILLDEQGQVVAKASTLTGLLKRVEAIPGLDDTYPS